MSFRTMIVPDSIKFDRPYKITLNALNEYQYIFTLQLEEIEVLERLKREFVKPNIPKQRSKFKQNADLLLMNQLTKQIAKRAKELRDLDDLINQCFYSQIIESQKQIA